MAGLIEGVRVVELASERAAFAGKLLAGMGAEVVVVEPPGGHHTRSFGPFAGDEPGPESSLWWRHYNTSKRGITLDLEREAQAFRELVLGADVVLEAERPGRLAELGIDFDSFGDAAPALIWVSVTPVGRAALGATDPFVDLIVQARGGPVWSCGYDDHSVPPVRPGGNQGYHTGSLWAVMGTLTALLHRDSGGGGQRVDVSMVAAANVTTEIASYTWLVEEKAVQRQTGRHASVVVPTAETLALAADGRYVTTGVPPRTGREFKLLLGWLDDLGLRNDFDDVIFLELGSERDHIDLAMVGVDAETTEIFGSGRSATVFIASKLNAYEFFLQGQQHGLTCGIVYSPEELLADEHFIDRGFVVTIDDDVLGRSYVAPGAPFVSSEASYSTPRAPAIGEHNDLKPATKPGR